MNDTNDLVTILIKAPNQRISDQTIYCEPSWTIKDLKHHLFNVYPNKPHPDGQKLIYSGCLLPDGAVISEVLRTYDGQQNNTIHLVCSPSKEVLQVPPPKSEKKNKVKPSDTTNAPIQQPPEPEPPVLPSDNDSDLRRRVPYVYLPNPWPQNNYEGYDQQQIYQQMVLMQQAYMQYMTQYFQSSNNGPNVVNPREREQRDQQENNIAAPQNHGGEEEGEEGDHLHRDWLDWVYIVSRVAVLFSIVYLYSSPVRCIMVTTMALLLYHLGMLRWRPVQINNNNNNNNNFNNRVEVGEEIHEEHVVEDRPPPQPQQPAEVHYPNWLMIAWTFLSSFFLSIIPEQREA